VRAPPFSIDRSLRRRSRSRDRHPVFEHGDLSSSLGWPNRVCTFVATRHPLTILLLRPSPLPFVVIVRRGCPISRVPGVRRRFPCTRRLARAQQETTQCSPATERHRRICSLSVTRRPSWPRGVRQSDSEACSPLSSFPSTSATSSKRLSVSRCLFVCLFLSFSLSFVRVNNGAPCADLLLFRTFDER